MGKLKLTVNEEKTRARIVPVQRAAVTCRSRISAGQSARLLHQDDFMAKVAAGAPIGLRDGQAQQAGLARFAPHRPLNERSSEAG